MDELEVVHQDIPEPATPFDSFTRELLHRVIEHHRSITIPMGDEWRVPGTIRWEFAATPSGSTECTMWFEPAEGHTTPEADLIVLE